VDCGTGDLHGELGVRPSVGRWSQEGEKRVGVLTGGTLHREEQSQPVELAGAEENGGEGGRFIGVGAGEGSR
jgi:hypothetical protein